MNSGHRQSSSEHWGRTRTPPVIHEHWLQLATLAVAVLCPITFGIWLRWEGVGLSVPMSNIGSLLAPLVFAVAGLGRYQFLRCNCREG